MHLRVLLIESEAEEILFLQDVFRDIEQDGWLPEWPKIEVEFAVTWAEAARCLATLVPQVVLLSPDLADRQGAETFRLMQAAAPDIPVVLLVNQGDEALAVKLVREGAQDFLLKKAVDCEPLAHAIRNAVFRHRLMAASRASSLIDPLTGLYNRTGFLMAAGRDHALADRLDRRWMTLVAMPRNLDAIGLAFGEQRRVLEVVEAADHLRSISGPTTLLGRIDDRHFGMAVFDTEAETVEEAWARIRAAAAERRIEIGVSIFARSRPIGLDAMLAQAIDDMPQRKAPGSELLSTVAGAA